MRQMVSQMLQKRAGVVLLLIGIVTVASAPLDAGAQDVANRFSSFTTDTNAPINIEADRLDVDDINKTATFTGKVVATQGTFTINAKALVVTYAGGAGGQGAGGDISRIQAKGPVLIESGENEQATGEAADFDVAAEKVTLTGNVVLQSGESSMHGDTLLIDLKTGRSTFQQQGGGGRVKAVFKQQPSQPASQ